MSKRFVNYKDESRKDWGLYRENHEDNSLPADKLTLGATLRIADAWEY